MDFLKDHSTRVGEMGDGPALFGQEHTIVPDGGGTIDACYVHHGGVVIVAGPDAHNVVCCIADRPVIFEVAGCTSLGGSGADGAAMPCEALLTSVGIELEDIAIKEPV